MKNPRVSEAQVIRQQREQEYPWSKGISNKIWNALQKRYGVRTRITEEMIRKELGDGSKEAYINSNLYTAINFGWKGWLALCEWAGLAPLGLAEQFERDHGSIAFLKASVTAVCKVLVNKGICTEEDLDAAFLGSTKPGRK